MSKQETAPRKPKNSRNSDEQDLKVALVCDWLTNPGGAEKVLLELHRLYPDAPIYTSQYNKKFHWFDDAEVKVGWLKIFPWKLRKFLGPLRQIYFSKLDLSEYDLVISVTGAEAKAVKTTNPKKDKKAFHLCYCHVPTQYYWKKYDTYLENPDFGIFNPLARLGLKLLVRPLRKADLKAASRPDQFVTISNYSKDQIKKYYHRDAKIVFPIVDVEKFAPKAQTAPSKTENSTKSKGFSTESIENFTDSDRFSTRNSKLSTGSSNLSTENIKLSTKDDDFSTDNAKFSTDFKELTSKKYYIIACRQTSWKKVDLAIQACLETDQKLVVVGEGPEHEKLVKLAQNNPKIHFYPWQTSASLAELLRHAEAYIFPSEEPFGIAAAEALATGCSVLAFSEGGSRDIVIPGKNGLLFSEQTVSSLVKTIQKFQSPSTKLMSRTRIAASVQKFSRQNFDQGIKEIVKSGLQSKSKKSSNNKTQSILTTKKSLLDRLIIGLVYLLPFALFMSYYPIIALGSSNAMNFELSVPLLWLVIFDFLILIKLAQLFLVKPRLRELPGISDRKIFLLALFPLYATLSVFWSANPVRGLLTAGIIWALFIAIFAILFVVPLISLPPKFRSRIVIAILGAGVLFSVVCWVQSILDTCGVPRGTTLLCRGCTYQSFGFPHPSGLAIEPQFMGNLLLAPALLGLYLIMFKDNSCIKNRVSLILATFFITTTLFLTFSRGAIYAYIVALTFLFGAGIIRIFRKKISPAPKISTLFLLPIVSFIIALGAQGTMAALSPTNDTFVTATTKAIHHLTLGGIDLRPADKTKNPNSEISDNGFQTTDKPSGENANFSGYVPESTNIRLDLNTVAFQTWYDAPGRTRIWQGFNCSLNLHEPCRGSRPVTYSSVYFGVGLGGAGTAMHEADPTSVTSPKEIVQNQPISLLLELGIFGIDFLILGFIVCFLARFLPRSFVDGKKAKITDPTYTDFWQNSLVIPLMALILAYFVSLNFFSGLPNALHIYLLPPLIYVLGVKSLPKSGKSPL